VATVAVSFSAIFISEATAPPLVTATYRMTLTTALLIPFALRRRRPQQLAGVTGQAAVARAALTRRDYALLLAAGALLALHFATWTVSLFYTSVASSTLFVTVHPVLVAALAWAWLGEKPRPIVTAGIALTLLGSLVIASGDVRLGGRALIGDGLALAGAVVFAFYLLIGRRVRQRLDPIAYSTPVYLCCAVVLAAIAIVGRQPFAPLTWHNLALFVALALVCTLGGHFVYNWTLKYLDTAVVSVSFLGEPVIAAALAWPLLGQPIHPLTFAGGAIILAGIYLCTK
jgi:drug/metabolite transporter (DMT)-like permease